MCFSALGREDDLFALFAFKFIAYLQSNNELLKLSVFYCLVYLFIYLIFSFQEMCSRLGACQISIRILLQTCCVFEVWSYSELKFTPKVFTILLSHPLCIRITNVYILTAGPQFGITIVSESIVVYGIFRRIRDHNIKFINEFCIQTLLCYIVENSLWFFDICKN